MKKILFRLCPILLLLSFACQDHDDFDVPSDLRIHDFIWKGLNLYYLWQPEVADLADDRFENQDQLNQWLDTRPAPGEFFQSLLTDPQTDRFSRIFSDYTVLEGILNGTTKSNGVDFELRYVPGSETQVFGWVRYVLPNSDAATKNIQRGDIFYAVDGQTLNENNYRDLLSSGQYTLSLADYDNGNITPSGESVSLTKWVISENPVYATQVFEVGAEKIGYIMYNGFYPAFESQLNQAFAQLKASGANHLILDLRYNSGGSIATSARLASMITGQFTGQIFAREQWNPKVQDYLESHQGGSVENDFVGTISNGSAISHLNLDRVYVLTGPATASASELVINGLKPYIQVVQIGTKTTGKNVGSITLYDSPDFGKDGASARHKYAMQPIVLKVVNRDGFGDYQTGILPDYELPEDLGNLGVIGDIGEPLLSTAIGQITANGRMMSRPPAVILKRAADTRSLEPLRQEMYSGKNYRLK